MLEFIAKTIKFKKILRTKISSLIHRGEDVLTWKARTYVVTAAMDHIDFIEPVRLGDLVTLKSSMNRAFTSSMEVGVKVWAENTRTGTVSHVASAYLVFVAVDEHGRLQKVPRLKPETADEIRRFEDALRRREHREREHARRKKAQIETAELKDAGAIEP